MAFNANACSSSSRIVELIKNSFELVYFQTNHKIHRIQTFLVFPSFLCLLFQIENENEEKSCKDFSTFSRSDDLSN